MARRRRPAVQEYEPGIEPGFVFYVDEAGSLDFHEPSPASPVVPFIATAVILPVLGAEKVLQVLPKSPGAGGFLKASSLNFSEEMCAAFAAKLMGIEFYAGMVLLDTSHPKSIEAARHWAAMGNAIRSSEHRQLVPLPNHIYEISVYFAVLNAFKAFAKINGYFLGLADVILDDKSISRAQRGEVHVRLMENFRKAANLRIRRVDWAAEEDAPLLLVPDLLAGLVHRHAVSKSRGHPTGECVQAWQVLGPARATGRLMVQHGLRFDGVPPRSAPE